ncbi:hypothetical protein C8F04DRAFT_1289113, partial [Mycena alexandri]
LRRPLSLPTPRFSPRTSSLIIYSFTSCHASVRLHFRTIISLFLSFDSSFSSCLVYGYPTSLAYLGPCMSSAHILSPVFRLASSQQFIDLFLLSQVTQRQPPRNATSSRNSRIFSECACTPASSISTPAAPAPPSMRPPVSRGRRTTPGSERERPSVSSAMDERAVSVEAGRQEEEGERDEHRIPEAGRGCVIRAIEDVVFPPVPSFTPSQHADDQQMEVDVKGEDGARMQGSSSSSIISLPTPRLGGASSLAPAAVIRGASLLPAAPSSSLHPYAAEVEVTSTSSSSSTTSASTTKRTRKRVAGLSVPRPSLEAPDPWWGRLIGASRGPRCEGGGDCAG